MFKTNYNVELINLYKEIIMAIFSFKYYFIILTSIIILLSNTQYAYATPSNEMYDYIIDSYFFGVKLGLNNLATSKNEDAKTKFVNKIKQNFNKLDFKNKTYEYALY